MLQRRENLETTLTGAGDSGSYRREGSKALASSNTEILLLHPLQDRYSAPRKMRMMIPPREASMPAEPEPRVHTMKKKEDESYQRIPPGGSGDISRFVSYWVLRSQMLLSDWVIQNFKLNRKMRKTQ